MRQLNDFELADEVLKGAKKETLESGEIKYTLSDGSYIMETDIKVSSALNCKHYEKHDTDGTIKKFDETWEYYADERRKTGHTLLTEIESVDKVKTLFQYDDDCRYADKPLHITSKENDAYELYQLYATGKSFGTYSGDQYCLVRKKSTDGVTRSLDNFDYSPSGWNFCLDDLNKLEITEECPNGTKRIYSANSLEAVEKFLAHQDGDDLKNYKGVEIQKEELANNITRYYEGGELVLEKGLNGLEREYENGYIVHEKLPNGTERFWEDGALAKEKVVIGQFSEMIDYSKDSTITTQKDGTVCTHYKGKLISENHPNAPHNTNTITVNKDENGILHASYPDGTPMIEFESKNNYKKWAQNGNLQEINEGGFKSYYNEETGHRVAIEGFGGLYVMQKGEAHQAMRDQFKKAIAKNDMKAAENYLLKMCVAADEHRPLYKGYDGISMLVRNSLDHTQIKILDNGMVAFGAIFEDRHYIKECYGGIEWYWRGAALVMDVETGSIVAQCETDRINVRDKYNPNRDKWKYIDTKNFMDVKGGKLTVRLASPSETYVSGSCKIDDKKYNEALGIIKKDKTISKEMQKMKNYFDKKKGVRIEGNQENNVTFPSKPNGRGGSNRDDR